MLQLVHLQDHAVIWHIWLDRNAHIIDHLQSGIIRYISHVCQTITFESQPWCAEFIIAHVVYLQGMRVKFVQEGQGHSSRKSIFPQCKTSIGNISGSIKHRAMKCACSMAFSTMVDQVVWTPSLSRDRKWRRVTKWTRSWVGRWSALD